MQTYRRKRRSPAERERMAREALARAEENLSEANYRAIIDGFVAKGIAEAEILPRQNVLTYLAWQAKGRQVRRGEHGVQIFTLLACTRKETDPETNAETEIAVQKRRRTTVFHVSQTDPLGDREPEPRPAPERSTPAERPVRRADPAQLRAKADALQERIDYLRNPAIARQRQTRRRASIAASMALDAQRLERVQQSLRAIAAAIEDARLPDCLAGVTTRSAVERILHREENEPARQLLLERLEGKSPEQMRRERIAELERQLLGVKIPGFFPTPRPLAERVCRLADIRPEHSVLEPSAGKGDLADVVGEYSPEQLELVEINGTLCDVLRAKGYEPHHTDFLALDGAGFDRVVMNPPFENFQDIDHVRHAYECLAPGGRLVAIVSEAPFFRSSRKADDFRAWLAHVGAETIPVENAFNGRESFRQTGVRCRIVVIDRKEG